MNIWIINHYAITPDMPGGTRHYDFGRELVKRGYKVTIFASSFHYLLHKELKLTKNGKYKFENVDGINFVWLKTFSYPKNDWRRVLNMISFMWRAYFFGKKITKVNNEIKKPDIIIGSSVHLLAVLSAYFLSKYYKAKFVMEVRDLWPQTLIDVGEFKENNPVIKILQSLEKFSYQKAQKIITLLPLAENYITSLGINKNKIIWIPNGVDFACYKNINGCIGEYLLSDTIKNETKGYSDVFFKIMYIGAQGKANVLDVILDTAKIIQDRGYKDIKFLFIGDGLEKKNLIKYRNELNLKNAEFWSPIAKEKIFTFLNMANALIFNLKDAAVFKYGISSNKLFDYMIAGKPIIFSANTPYNYVEKSGCGISVSTGNPKDIAEAILKLYKMPVEERRKMGQKGKEYVEKYHSIPVLVDKLEKVIKEVMHEKTISNED